MASMAFFAFFIMLIVLDVRFKLVNVTLYKLTLSQYCVSLK